jgi:hypothetical protein
MGELNSQNVYHVHGDEKDGSSILLHLTDNLARSPKALHHLLALLSASDRVVALFQQVIQLVVAVHVLEQLPLHFVLAESGRKLAYHNVYNMEIPKHTVQAYT